jgi:hypothetical protein
MEVETYLLSVESLAQAARDVGRTSTIDASKESFQYLQS